MQEYPEQKNIKKIFIINSIQKFHSKNSIHDSKIRYRNSIYKIRFKNSIKTLDSKIRFKIKKLDKKIDS